MSILRIKIGNFNPKYDSTMNYGYYGIRGDNLKKLLYEINGGYCMYCFTKVNVDSKYIGHLEHSIEKKHSEKLIECVPNIGLACPKCNLSFKKVGENDVKFTLKQLDKYSRCYCNSSSCNRECSHYKILRRHYIKKRKIILQPGGVVKNGTEYLLQYNLLTLEFEPDSDINYSTEELSFIYKHIERFNLNDSQYRTRELLYFCKDTINGDVYLRKGKYSNYIVDVFMELIQYLHLEDRIKLCEAIYTIGMYKRII